MRPRPRRTLVLLLSALLTLATWARPAPPERTRRSRSAGGVVTDPTAPWIVSLGDSYISGEAGRWAGNTGGSSRAVDALGPTAYFDNASGTGEVIPLCHRSRSAMIGIGDGGTPTTPGSAVNSLNLACSGAETTTYDVAGQPFKPGLDFYVGANGKEGQAKMLQDFATTHDVRDGRGVDRRQRLLVRPDHQGLRGGLPRRRRPLPGRRLDAEGRVPTNVATVQADVTQALLNVQTAMKKAGHSHGSWTLVVNINPEPLPTRQNPYRNGESCSRWYTGGCALYDSDTWWAEDTYLPLLTGIMQNAVAKAAVPGTVTLDLRTMLVGHELCPTSDYRVGASGGATIWRAPGAVNTSEWVNQIRVEDSGPYFEQESLHPDYWAQLAARSCVRQVWNAGKPQGGACVLAGAGLTARGEPVMTLTAEQHDSTGAACCVAAPCSPGRRGPRWPARPSSPAPRRRRTATNSCSGSPTSPT